jgi:hypothetical protein
MTEPFENEWTAEVDRLRKVHDEMALNIEGKQSLIDKMVHENVVLVEALRKLLLAVLARESAGYFDGWNHVSMEHPIEQAKAALEMAVK